MNTMGQLLNSMEWPQWNTKERAENTVKQEFDKSEIEFQSFLRSTFFCLM